MGGGETSATTYLRDSQSGAANDNTSSLTTSPPMTTIPSASLIPTSTTTTATISSTSTSTTTTAPRQLDTGDVAGFRIINARLGDRSLLLALADTTALRSRGLMGVESLGQLDGMVFVWEDPLGVSFWMKNTLIPLDIGYFDEAEHLFLVLGMTPCTADPCPTYPSEKAVRYALEAVPGFFDDVALGESLTLGDTVASP